MKYQRWAIVLGVLGILFAGVGLAQTSGDFAPYAVDFIKASRKFAKVRGKLTNNSGKTLAQGEFVILVYNEAGNLITSAPFTVRNFVRGSTRGFKTTIQANAKDISSYKVEFKHREIGSLQTGGDFVPQGVDFIKISSRFAKARGKLSNNSGKDLRQAEFLIQVYDQAGNLITSAPFTVRNFMNGSARGFNTTIQANVKDISSYQVEFKGGNEIPPSPMDY